MASISVAILRFYFLIMRILGREQKKMEEGEGRLSFYSPLCPYFHSRPKCISLYLLTYLLTYLLCVQTLQNAQNSMEMLAMQAITTGVEPNKDLLPFASIPEA